MRVYVQITSFNSHSYCLHFIEKEIDGLSKFPKFQSL